MHKKAAFTMVELIFVIVILGILAAVAVPKLNASRTDAKVTKLVTDVVTIMRDVRSYYAANGELVRRVAYPGVSEENCLYAASNTPRLQAIWQDGVCYARENSSRDNDNLSHITNVPMRADVYYSAIDAIDGELCLVFQAGHYDSDNPKPDVLIVRAFALPDANASGDGALCKRLLAHPAVKAALTNEKGYTVGEKDNDGNPCYENAQCTIAFSLGSSEISWD